MIARDFNCNIGDILWSSSSGHSDDTESSCSSPHSQEVDGIFCGSDNLFEDAQYPHTIPPYVASHEDWNRCYSGFSSPDPNQPPLDFLVSDSELVDDLDKSTSLSSSPTISRKDKEAGGNNGISVNSSEQKGDSDKLSLTSGPSGTGKRKYKLKIRSSRKRNRPVVQSPEKNPAKRRKTDRTAEEAAQKDKTVKTEAAKKAAEDNVVRKAASRKAEETDRLGKERLEPLDRDASMKFFGIQCQNKSHKGKRVGFISRKFNVSHEYAVCAVLKKESERGYDELPRSKRIFEPKITPDMSGADFKNLDLECENIDTSQWWHAQYNSDEFLSLGYWSSNLFLMSDLKKDGELLAQKHAIITGYKINGVWKSILFGRGRKKRKPGKKDSNAWKNNFHGDPFFHPKDHEQKNPKVAINEIRNVRDVDRIQLRVLEFTETAKVGKPGSLKLISEILPYKMSKARRIK